jgi:hypothetical protein
MTELSKMPGYKTQEAEDRGLQALTNLPKMERAQFLEALKAKPPVTPLPRDTQEEHHEAYTLPGGKNYREILLQHPNSTFKGVSSHFGGAPNILASVRAKDRTGPNGEKILHIEELQSDWHQQGREKGYTPPDVAKQINAAERAHRELKKQLDQAKDSAALAERGLVDPTTKRMRDLNPEMNQRLEASKLRHNNTIMELMPQVMKAEAEHQDLLHQSKNTVPDAPFKKSWHEMALKKMIHHAAANGYDSIAITPGAEQADRYGLAKHLGEVQYNHEFKRLAGFDKSGTPVIYHADVEPEQLPNYIGKEVATKLLAQPKNNQEHSLKGVDLQVGGEGMKGFYDKIVPNFLNQFGKKYGAKVQTVPLALPTIAEHFGQTEEQFQALPQDVQEDMHRRFEYQRGKTTPKTASVHTFPITPEMREDVTKNGVPLYAKGGEVEVKPTNYDPNLQRKHPELEAAIRGISAGTTTHKQLDKLIAKHKPIKPYEFVPQPATDEDAERALKPAQKPKWRGHEQWPAGRKVGLRLDIPAYESHGVWVNSVHDEEGKGEDNLKVAYGPVSSVKNAVFDPTPHKAEEVGTGEKGKSSFARIKGDLHHMSEDEAVEHMKTYLNHPDYAQVGFDPRRHGHFYDRKTMKPVTHSAHVVQIGPLVLAHKPTYGKRENYAKGGEVSRETTMGINVRSDKKANLQYADLIVDGHKTYESRNGDTLRPYVGKRVSIVRTGDGPAKAIGAVTVGEPMVVNRKKFREMEQHHLVPEGSAFDIASGTKHLYPMHNPERYDSERDVGHGIVARKVHMAGGGKVKPLSERFDFGKAGEFDPIGNAKKSLRGAYDVVSKIPGNLKRLVTDPVAYAKSLPAPGIEQLAGAFNPAHIGGIMMGPGSRTWNQKSFEDAVHLAGSTGNLMPPKEVWKRTGNIPNARDFVPRQEINDSNAKFYTPAELKYNLDEAKAMLKWAKQQPLLPKWSTLPDEHRNNFLVYADKLNTVVQDLSQDPAKGIKAKYVLDHPELYAAYPELGEMLISQPAQPHSTTKGGFNSKRPEVTIFPQADPRGTAIHEMQHAVQNIEGMSPGTNPLLYGGDLANYLKFHKAVTDAYPNLNPKQAAEDAMHGWYSSHMGEAEARQATKRMDMSPQERLNNFPDYDTKPNWLIDKPAEAPDISLDPALKYERPASYAKGGRIKPIGYTKEQVTVSPNLDAMRYELMSVKRYTKKVK